MFLVLFFACPPQAENFLASYTFCDGFPLILEHFKMILGSKSSNFKMSTLYTPPRNPVYTLTLYTPQKSLQTLYTLFQVYIVYIYTLITLALTELVATLSFGFVAHVDMPGFVGESLEEKMSET